MDKNTKELFNALVDELGQMEDRLNCRIENVEIGLRKDIVNLQHEVNALKLEVTTNQFIVEELRLLKHRVDDLEKRGA